MLSAGNLYTAWFSINIDNRKKTEGKLRQGNEFNDMALILQPIFFIKINDPFKILFFFICVRWPLLVALML